MGILFVTLVPGLLILCAIVALVVRTKKLRTEAAPTGGSAGTQETVVKGVNLIDKQRQLSEEWENTTTKREKLKMLKMAGAAQNEG